MKKDKSSVLVWERTPEGKRVCKHYPTPLYFYIEDEDGEYTSMYNKPLTKIECDSYGQFWGTKEDFKSRRIPVYESDIHPEYKILSENYFGKFGKPNVTYYDIEVDYQIAGNEGEYGFAGPTNPYAPVSAVSLYHEYKKQSILYAVPPKNFNIDNVQMQIISTDTNCEIIICKNEKELLLKLMDELDNTDVLSGWNCIPLYQHVWLQNKITNIGKMKEIDCRNLHDSLLERVFPKTTKQIVRVTLENGKIVESSEDHIFPFIKKNKKNYVKNLHKTEYYEDSIKNISSAMDENYIYFKGNLRDNNNKQLTVGNFIHDNLTELTDLGLDVYVRTELLTRAVTKIIGISASAIKKGLKKWFTWNYLKNHISKEFFLNELLKCETLQIKSNDSIQYTTLNRDDEFTNDDMWFLGMWYTDGTNSYKSNITISNTDNAIIERLVRYTGTQLRFDSREKYKNNKLCFQVRTGLFVLKNLILKTFIYRTAEKKSKKQLNVEFLSQLSNTQFGAFIAGCVDGDGSLKKQNSHRITYTICNYNGDIQNFQELLEWNGIFCWAENNLIVFSKNLSEITHSKKQNVKNLPESITSNKHSNKITRLELINQNEYIIKVRKIEYIDEFVEMIDIQTNTHYFVTNGIKTHNCYGYDDPYIYERLKIVFGQFMANRLSFDGAKIPYYKEVLNKFKIPTNKLILSGRVSLDYMELFIKFQQGNRDSYSLDAIAEEELPHLPKMEYKGSLYELYNDNFYEFIRYNARDTEILKGLEDKFGYMALAIQMAQTNTCKLEDVLGTIKLTELAIINECHHSMNVKVPDSKESSDIGKARGAFVVPTIPGMYELVGTIDVGGLYPSGIRALNISPECIIGQFYDNQLAFQHIRENNGMNLTILYENSVSETKNTQEWRDYFIQNNCSISGCGTVFDQNTYGIFPTILTKWFHLRKEYKDKIKELSSNLLSLKNDTKDYSLLEEQIKYYDRLQNIVKLSSNSFYGSLLNKFFKFYDIRLGESTTLSGQEINKHNLRKIGEIMTGEYVYPNSAIIYGDTDSVGFKTNADNLEDAIAVGKYAHKIINASFPEFLQKTFFVNEKYSNTIAIEFETLTKRGIWVKPKNYVLNLGYKDGKFVDAMKIMGVKIKKTNIPKFIRKDLTKFVTKLVKENNWKSLGLEIVEYRDKIKNSTTQDIGLPIQIKGLEQYTANYIANNKEKTKMPGHVAASVCWNEMLDNHNDKETQKISSGMKIKTFYLRKNIRHFKSIAIPTDLKILPKWFIEEVEPLIDNELQVIRLVDNALKQILDAVNERLPTKQSLLVDEEFY